MKEVNFEILMNNIRTYIDDEKSLDNITRAFWCANKLHEGQKRQSGEDYIVHPLSVAFILSEMKADSDTICAALLHDTIEDTIMSKEKIAIMFNETIANLVDGVTKISKMNFSSKEQQIATNTRKIITSLEEDVRIVIIKLADRLHNMRTLEYKSEFKQKENALETMEIFSPLAYYLGAYQIKSELEDLALYYLRRDYYDNIENQLNIIREELDNVIYQALEKVGNVLADNNISFEHKQRIKSIYGLYKQIIRGKNIIDVHDLVAIKIMVDDVNDCFRTLGYVHSVYPPINNKFKDYIFNPKTNMYQSLHTTVFGPDDRLVQMQIRTYDMDKIDTYGLTAYWDLHKNDAEESMQDDLKNKYQFFKSISELNSIISDNAEFVNSVKRELFNSTIYVYTPKGDIIELPKGSTPIDFAYKLHTDIGNTMVGAIVHDTYVNVDYQLQNTDRIKIITNPLIHGPKLEWEDKVKTIKAKKLIKQFYK